MLELLSSEKERAELDMLIDLGRNDLKRVCTSGIEMTSYRHVEKYSRVMHTIAHLTGNLRNDRDALDALIACQSAGTLTGAPKVQAMIEIEKQKPVVVDFMVVLLDISRFREIWIRELLFVLLIFTRIISPFVLEPHFCTAPSQKGEQRGRKQSESITRDSQRRIINFLYYSLV